MNEVTKIHLGRQPFTISVEAHHELKSYLEAIKKQVNDKEVLEEIELRMAELLVEHGIDTKKVILIGDVNFLQEQLGSPKEFSEDDEGAHSDRAEYSYNRKLFRDTDNAVVAGVSSGLAKYFGLDVLLIRLLFIIFTIFTAGWGILLYIVLWLLVPEAKTSSDRLLMAGKPVTVDSLKELAERADVKGAVHRANTALARPINSIFELLLKIIGLMFMLIGLSTIFGLIATTSYILLNNHAFTQNNIFPIGFREHLVFGIAAGVVSLIALFVILFGVAIFRRKWPIRTWVTGILIGLILIGTAVGGALAANVYPNVRDRYNANTHTIVRGSEAFNSINIIGGDGVQFNIDPSSKYYISFNYYDHPNLASIKTYVKNNVLTIDTSQFNWHRNCPTICIPNTYNMVITVFTPNADRINNQLDNGPIFSPGPIPKPFLQ